MGWRGDPAILRDTTANQLELKCSGNVIAARINGTEVASRVDTTYSTGGLRIGVGSYPDASGPTEARFQSLVVLQAAPPEVDQTPPASPTPLAETAYETPNRLRTASQLRAELARARATPPNSILRSVEWEDFENTATV